MKQEVAAKNSYLGKRAIVVGAGLGGLSAARVLSDYFDEVMILDRDELPDDAIPRPGVPQGKHAHLLLAGGLKALENLFPGLGNELMRAGAESIDPGFDSLIEVSGRDVWPKIKFGWSTYSMTRPLIERVLRRQVERRANIKVRGGRRVLNIISESNVHAARCVMSAPCKNTCPRSALVIPVRILNMVVLPELFGPITPSASPFVEMHAQIVVSQQRAEALGYATEF
jgi:hypothetical protein